MMIDILCTYWALVILDLPGWQSASGLILILNFWRTNELKLCDCDNGDEKICQNYKMHWRVVTMIYLILNSLSNLNFDYVSFIFDSSSCSGFALHRKRSRLFKSSFISNFLTKLTDIFCSVVADCSSLFEILPKWFFYGLFA